MHLLLCEEVTSAVAGTVVHLPSQEARHATAALRMVSGDLVLVSDGRGRKCVGQLEVRDSGVLVTIRSVTDEPVADPTITVVQALAKGEHGELAIDLMTQVGVDIVLPWAAQRSVVQLKGDRADKALVKWQHAARAAAKQSRRARLPQVLAVQTTKQLLPQLNGFDAVFLLHEAADRVLASAELPSSGRICVIVGPEGGIAPEEHELLTDAGAVPAVLGAEVLRASLAGAVAVSLLASRLRWAAPRGHVMGR